MKCNWCGVEDETVRERIDPYMWEMFDMEVKVCACEECIIQRTADV